MMFSLCAFFVVGARDTSIEELAAELSQYFKDEQDFNLSTEILPFAKSKSIALRWGQWLARVVYEEGKHIEEELSLILKTVPLPSESMQFSSRRLRVVFGDDPSIRYTNQIIYVTDFMREVSGAPIYDPQRREFF